MTPFLTIAADRTVAAGLGFLVVYGSAQVLPEKEFSAFVIAESLRVGCLAFCDSPVGQAMVHRIGAAPENARRAYGAALLVKLCAWAVVSLTCVATAWMGGLSDTWRAITLMMPVLIGLSMICSTAQQFLLSGRRYRSLLTLDGVLLAVLLTLYFAIGDRPAADGALAILLVVALVRGVSGSVALFLSGGMQAETGAGEVSSTLRFARSALAGHVASYLNVRADPILLGALCTSRAVGIWGLAAPCLQLYSVIGEASSQDLFPAVASRNERPTEIRSLILKSFRSWTLAAVAVSVLIWILPVAKWLPGSGENVSEIQSVLVLLAISGLFLVVARIGAAANNGLGRPVHNATASWAGLAVKVAAGVFLIDRFGAYGAALAAVLVSGIMALVVWILLRAELDRRGTR